MKMLLCAIHFEENADDYHSDILPSEMKKKRKKKD